MAFIKLTALEHDILVIESVDEIDLKLSMNPNRKNIKLNQVVNYMEFEFKQINIMIDKIIYYYHSN